MFSYKIGGNVTQALKNPAACKLCFITFYWYYSVLTLSTHSWSFGKGCYDVSDLIKKIERRVDQNLGFWIKVTNLTVDKEKCC